MKRQKSSSKKDIIVAEYLHSDISFRDLGSKYEINLRTIQNWVRAYRIKHKMTTNPIIEEEGTIEENAGALKKQLEQMQLKNELLEEILRLSKEETGVDLRKKYGTKQSRT